MLLVAFTGVICWSSMNGTLDRHMWDIHPLKYQTVALVSFAIVRESETTTY